MRDATEKVWTAIGCTFIFAVALYVAGYLFTVRRLVSRTGTQPMVGGGTRELYVVTAKVGDGMTRQFLMPALKVDRHYIRKRYWASWYVVVSGGKTNILSEEEMRRRLQP